MRTRIAVSLALYGSALQACPVCGFGQDGTAYYFILTTALLTFAPLILIGGVIYALWRQIRASARERSYQNENTSLVP